ncbi:hypothetical protein AAHH78_40025, partial [Burkholderia pseudomallei]
MCDVRRHRHTIFIDRETARRTGTKPPHQAAASRWIGVSTRPAENQSSPSSSSTSADSFAAG